MDGPSLQITEVSKKSEDSALGVEVRLEKGCLSKAEVEALQGGGGLQDYAAERRCWVGRKVEETRQGGTKTSRVERQTVGC